jgi:hypothetical protein
MDVKDIIVRISKLHDKEKIHVLNILKSNNIQFTKNSNGYFFNLLELDSCIILKICECLDLIEKNVDLIKDMDKKRYDLLLYYKKLIEEKLKQNMNKKKDDYIQCLILKKESNISMNFNRSCKFKKIKKFAHYNMENDTGVHPDVIVREYIKLKFKYPKNSVYSRILSNLKNKKPQESVANEVENSENDFDNIIEVDENISEVGDSLDDVDVDAEVEVDIDIDIAADIDVDVLEDDIDLIEEKQSIEEDDTVDQEDTQDMKILYYKKLLNKQGFIFDDNKDCLLIYQEYIN